MGIADQILKVLSFLAQILPPVFITSDQLLVHSIGDYLTQSDWMAQNKTKAHFPAFCHALIYSLGFLVLSPSWKAWLVIFGTHFLIDRYRLARYVVWAKNVVFAPSIWWWKDTEDGAWKSGSICPPGRLVSRSGATLPWHECSGTGYPPSSPTWLSVWLLIIADNILHVAINGAALRWL